MDKKGADISVNVIIVAALALIVLVVLIVVFTGRMQIFKEGISKESQTELIKMKIYYGQCRPSGSSEDTFMQKLDSSELPEEKEDAKQDFKSEIDRCKEFVESKDVCESESGCIWG